MTWLKRVNTTLPLSTKLEPRPVSCPVVTVYTTGGLVRGHAGVLRVHTTITEPLFLLLGRSSLLL